MMRAPFRSAMRSSHALLLTMLVVATLSGTACQREDGAVQAPEAKGAGAQVAVSSQAASPAAAPVPGGEAPLVLSVDRVPTVELALPRTVPLGPNGDLSFTITEVTVEPRNTESMRLVLLVRMHNKRREPAEFADENFRLLTRNSEIPASGGIGETLDAGAESGLERVQFVVPLGAVPRALRIDHTGDTVETPLVVKW